MKNERQSITRLRTSLIPMQREKDFLQHMLENLPKRIPQPEINTMEYQNQNFISSQYQQQYFQQQQYGGSNQLNNFNKSNIFSLQQSQYQDQAMQNPLIQNTAQFGGNCHANSQFQYDSSQLESEIENEQNNQQRNFEKQQKQPPKNYITVSEFQEIPQYIKGRLTMDKMNAALDDLVEFSIQNQKLMQQVKQKSVKLSESQRNVAVELYHNVASKYKRKFWFCERDLQGGKIILTGKTGKSILTALRHLKRLKEVRVSILGQQTNVYLLE
eukprot:TRINITY_DN1803_c0_g2_i2.p1 TRINITY_DN1803_c0_g2~~TRINITY_DN1803_c0_g2_i2.p1  ORF type:complete len:271 (+),score=16.75 TRINITY_DN1803_c0_g2_i2:475-1287(+)